MKYRILGKTGLNVSVIGLGAWQFGGEWGRSYSASDVRAILDKARECGINLIDTAECYGDHLSESLIGSCVARRRSQWVIATKFGHQFHSFLDRSEHWSPPEVEKQLEASLQALRTDYVDIYQFHSGSDEVFRQDDLWEMLNKKVQAGKIRHLGISLSRAKNCSQVEAAAKYNCSVVQIYYNRLAQEPEAELFPFCQRQNLGVLARVPLASGLLSGKYKPGVAFPENDVRSNRNPKQLERDLQRVAEIQRNEVRPGVPMAQWALAWCLRHPAVTCVIPGCKDASQVEANAKAADLEL